MTIQSILLMATLLLMYDTRISVIYSWGEILCVCLFAEYSFGLCIDCIISDVSADVTNWGNQRASHDCNEPFNPQDNELAFSSFFLAGECRGPRSNNKIWPKTLPKLHLKCIRGNSKSSIVSWVLDSSITFSQTTSTPNQVWVWSDHEMRIPWPTTNLKASQWVLI